MQQIHKAKHKWTLGLAMGVFGTLGPFTRQIPVSSGELALYRALLAAALLGCYLLFTKQKTDLASIRRELWLLLLSGGAVGLNWILLFEAYKYTTISVATLSYYFAPVLVMLSCPLLFRERLRKKQVLCFIMSTAGLVMTIGVGGSSGKGTDGLGVLCGLGAAAFYATVILMNKALKEVAGIHRTFVQFLGAILTLVPYVALTGGADLRDLDLVGWGCLLVVGLVHTGVNYCLYFSSLKELPGQTVAILSYVDPLVALLVSFFVLGERMSPLQLVGGALILGFTLYNELELPKRSSLE